MTPRTLMTPKTPVTTENTNDNENAENTEDTENAKDTENDEGIICSLTISRILCVIISLCYLSFLLPSLTGNYTRVPTCNKRVGIHGKGVLIPLNFFLQIHIHPSKCFNSSEITEACT